MTSWVKSSNPYIQVFVFFTEREQLWKYVVSAEALFLEERKDSGSTCVSTNTEAYRGTVDVAFY